MEEHRLLFFALLFIAAVSVLGLFAMMRSSGTAFAWGNVYENGNSYRNCYCHNGVYMVSQPRDPGSGIYGPEVKFLGKSTQNQCSYECQKAGYQFNHWIDPDANSAIWPRRSW